MVTSNALLWESRHVTKVPTSRVGVDVHVPGGIPRQAVPVTSTIIEPCAVVGIGDAVKAIKTKVIEVHISNTFSREDFRHNSFITPHAKGLITGFGLDSYYLAVTSFVLNDYK